MNDLELDMFHKYFSSNYWSFFTIAALELLTFSLNYSQHFRLITKPGYDEMAKNDRMVTSARWFSILHVFSSVWKVWSGNKFLFLIRNESEALESKEQKLPSCIITADSTFELKIKYLDFLLWLSKKMIIQKNGQYGDRTRDIRVISTTL